ncbi:hypothetical protein AWC38_SpisGene10313 [Stylophora pistillata]|uniref:Uncharacterized protein n=1 Tax=Stylophora pistillata TaxID=50429 RepID=A0A2B4S5A4_STYPI|nr:hypothetical protein AWC38_SpisGene10313 [Stylophora pistillata]
MMESFYLTLPSNDDSIKYFPENTPNSWKNRLSSLIALDKDWEVGMSSISLPHESRLKKYLHNIPEKTRLLTTKRRVYVVVTQQLDVTTNYVHYSDINDKPLDTPHDLLKALFEVEREKFILDLEESGVWANEMPTGKFPNLQFDFSFDDVLETCTVSPEKIIPDTLSNNDVRDNVYFELRKDLCILLGWVQPKAWFNVISVKNAQNLAFRKRGNIWFEPRTIAKRYWSMEENGEMVKFYLHELVWTFINTKQFAYKRGTSASRTFYVYSSIGDPVTIGSQRTDLLLQVPYHPQLHGSFFYAPPKIHYIPLRNSMVDVSEIQISETDTNSLTQFDDGTSIVTLHFRKKKRIKQRRLTDGFIMMKSYRELYINSGCKDTCVVVSYGDIKDTPMTTAYDFLKILFDREYELFLDQLTQDHSLVHKPGKEQLQFDTIFNEEEGTITVISEKVDDSVFSSRTDFKLHCHFALRKDMCELFGWTKSAQYKSADTFKSGPNLVMRKRGTQFVEDRRDSSHCYYRYGLLDYSFKGSDDVAAESIIFFLDEFTHTFTNRKESTYKNGMAPRTLYLYSSLCAPVIMGDQTCCARFSIALY